MSWAMPEEEEDEFCRACGISVSWTSEEWVHDYAPDEDHEPVVPTDRYEDDDDF